MKFQSLFQWILHSNIFYLRRREIFTCFNPCFSGSCIRILYQFAKSQFPALVSILVLVDLAFELVNPQDVQDLDELFQSLFQWILHSNMDILLYAVLLVLGFNPCFSGSCIRMCLSCLGGLGLKIVSILVLVDLAFECRSRFIVGQLT